jgi:hypothetical protein
MPKNKYFFENKRGEKIPLETEGWGIDWYCWSPDMRFVLYRVDYNRSGFWDTSSETSFLFLFDKKARRTYRFLEGLRTGWEHCHWLPERF